MGQQYPRRPASKGTFREGHGERTAVVFFGIAFDATALTFNVWQYARQIEPDIAGAALDGAGASVNEHASAIRRTCSGTA
jgi:hypothetical protein